VDTASNKKKIAPLPNHIGIIMDGNRRWAKRHGLGALEGHFAALKNLHSLLEYFNEQQIKDLAAYVLSL